MASAFWWTAASGLFDGAEGEAANEVALQPRKHDSHRNRGGKGGSHDVVPFNGVTPGDQGEDLNWQRVALLPAEHGKRYDELVPRIDESEDGSDRHRWHGERQKDHSEGLKAVCSFNPRRLLEILRDGREVALQHPDREGDVERRVDDHDRVDVVEET